MKQQAGALFFQKGALFLDKEQLVTASGKALQAFGFHRPDQANLENSATKSLGASLIDPRQRERLAQVTPGLGRGHQAKPRARPAQDPPVQSIDARIVMEARQTIADDDAFAPLRAIVQPGADFGIVDGLVG